MLKHVRDKTLVIYEQHSSKTAQNDPHPSIRNHYYCYFDAHSHVTAMANQNVLTLSMGFGHIRLLHVYFGLADRTFFTYIVRQQHK